MVSFLSHLSILSGRDERPGGLQSRALKASDLRLRFTWAAGGQCIPLHTHAEIMVGSPHLLCECTGTVLVSSDSAFSDSAFQKTDQKHTRSWGCLLHNTSIERPQKFP